MLSVRMRKGCSTGGSPKSFNPVLRRALAHNLSLSRNHSRRLSVSPARCQAALLTAFSPIISPVSILTHGIIVVGAELMNKEVRVGENPDTLAATYSD